MNYFYSLLLIKVTGHIFYSHLAYKVAENLMQQDIHSETRWAAKKCSGTPPLFVSQLHTVYTGPLSPTQIDTLGALKRNSSRAGINHDG